MIENCSFLDSKKLLLFPRNLFHTSHHEKYRWFQGGPRKIIEVLMDSRGSRRLKGVSRVVGIPGVSVVLQVPGIPEVRGSQGSQVSRISWGSQGPRTRSHFSTIPFIFWLSFLCEISGNMSIAIVYQPGCDVMNFKINLIFLIKPFFQHDQKVITKM